MPVQFWSTSSPPPVSPLISPRSHPRDPTSEHRRLLDAHNRFALRRGRDPARAGYGTFQRSHPRDRTSEYGSLVNGHDRLALRRGYVPARAGEVVVRDFAEGEFLRQSASGGRSSTTVRVSSFDYSRDRLHSRSRNASVTRAQFDSLFANTIDIVDGVNFEDDGERTPGQSDMGHQYAIDIREIIDDDEAPRPRRYAIDTLHDLQPNSDSTIISFVYKVAQRICGIFESNEPFALFGQPIFHDPLHYLNFRTKLSPVRLADQIRPYILHFRHALWEIKYHTKVKHTQFVLPGYCRHLDLLRADDDRHRKPVVALILECFHGDNYDITGFYLKCELLWRVIAENRHLESDFQIAVGGHPDTPSERLQTKERSVLKLLKDNNPLPPPLLPEVGMAFSGRDRADELWNHLQYLPKSPLDSDPQDPNLSIGLAQHLEEELSIGHHHPSLCLRGGGCSEDDCDWAVPELEDDMESIDSAPDLAEYSTLDEYQQQTPSTFFTASKPVLYLHAPQSKVILQGQNAISKFNDLLGRSAANGVNGSNHDAQEILEADIYVDSSVLILWAASKGVRIEYPTIGIHGMSSITISDQTERALYMQLNLYDQEASNSDDDVETADVSIIPGTSSTTSDSGHRSTADLSSEDAVKALYDAVSDCQNLHPDPQEDGDEDDGARQPVLGTAGAPGDGGWITSANMAQFTDSNGNFIGFGGEDGPAVAGTRRPREEDDEQSEEADQDGETKWQRTD